MVDVLFTFGEIRTALPDNTAQLISPEDSRSATLSAVADVGEVGDGTPFVMALAAGVPSNLNVLSPAPTSTLTRGWLVNGNAALVNDLSDEFEITPGHIRGVQVGAVIVGQNAGVGDDTFTFDLMKGVVVVGSVTAVLEGGANSEDLAMGIGALVGFEPALAEPWSIQVTSAAGNDYAVDDWDMRVLGMPI